MELSVEKILKEKGIWYRLVKLNQKAYTVEDVVKYSNSEVELREICKTIILTGKKTGKKLAAFLRGTDRLDFSKAKQLFGEEMKIASNDEVKEAAGVEAGAVCPFLLSVPLYVDNKVIGLEKVNCGSGDHLHGLEFQVGDLGKVVNYKKVDLVK